MLNKVMLIGRLGADPEMRYTPSGDPIATLRLATTRRWKDRNTNERKEETEWHRVTFFGSLGKIAGEYLKKGSTAHIEGRLKTNKFEKNGVETYATSIIGENLILLDKRDGASSESQSAGASQQDKSSPQDYEDGFDDDIPF